MDGKNGEGYRDPTASDAIREADQPPKHVKAAVSRMKMIARWHGLEVTNRIWLKDTKTGREWR